MSGTGNVATWSDTMLELYTSAEETKLLIEKAGDVAIINAAIHLSWFSRSEDVAFKLSDGQKLRMSVRSAKKMHAQRESEYDARRDLYISAHEEKRSREQRKAALERAAEIHKESSEEDEDEDKKTSAKQERKRRRRGDD